MALHGRTKIELTDVHTGKVATLEKGNFITNAIAEYTRPLGGLMDSYGLLYGTHITDFFGGLCLFNKPLEGDENTFFPQGGAAQVGAAEYGLTNGTSDTWLGSYNTNESVIDYINHTATFVYDFTTAQANGNIGAVCLAPAGCGTGGVWGIEGGTTHTAANVSYTGSNDASWHEIWLNPYTAQYNNTSNQIVPVCWDVENDVGYYINMTVKPFKLEKHRLYMKNASLFYDQRFTNTTRLEAVELEFDAPCNFYTTGYDMYDATHFCLYGYNETSSAVNAYAGKLYCFVFGLDGALYKTITIESPCRKTSVSDISMGYLKGYILLAGGPTEEDGTWPIYRVPENNPTDIQAAEIGEMKENERRHFKFSLGETYFCSNNTCVGSEHKYQPLAYNVAANRITTTDARISVPYDYNQSGDIRCKQVPILGRPLFFLQPTSNISHRQISDSVWMCRVRMFLSTINNLDEPVTKTADKTMKITYTITEVAE